MTKTGNGRRGGKLAWFASILVIVGYLLLLLGLSFESAASMAIIIPGAGMCFAAGFAIWLRAVVIDARKKGVL